MQQDAPQLRLRPPDLPAAPRSTTPSRVNRTGSRSSSCTLHRLLVLLQPAAAAAANRYHALALDQRGHGDSERPDDGYTVEDFAADALRSGCCRGERATVVGHSAGSFIARRGARSARVGTSAGADRLGGDAGETGDARAPGGVPRWKTRAGRVCARVPGGQHLRPATRGVLRAAVTRASSCRPGSGRAPGRLPRVDDARDWDGSGADTDDLGDRDGFFFREGWGSGGRDPRRRLLVYPETGHAVQWERPERSPAT